MSEDIKENWAPLNVFFEKLKKLIPPQESKIKILQDAIKDSTGIVLQKEKIKIKNKFVYLEISAVQKNEILLRKERVLSVLQEKFPKLEIIDIR